MMKIMKASAGSGKTFNLAKEYIRLLLTAPPEGYRHILAVTFTNKATDEMKNRILRELFVLSSDCRRSGYYADFVPALFPDGEQLREAAAIRLWRILHDYSSFAISTIDRFFQQTLRAFSREIGQFSSYQVALDRAALVEESVDRILESLTERDTQLISWLSASVIESLDAGEKRFNLDHRLQQIAKRLKSEDFAALIRSEGIDEDQVYDREHLSTIRRDCRRVIGAFVEDLRAAASEVLAVFQREQISPEATLRHFAVKLYDYAAWPDGAEVPLPTASLLQNLPDSLRWFPKKNERYRLALEGKLEEPARCFVALFGDRFRTYRTACIIRKQLYALGIAAELKKEFVALQQEKNVLSLDDSNHLLRDIIDGSDAPFVYEKLGVRFEHFLLDEFQDTSLVQWNNFRPLLKNSEASGFDNLVVGDVKQSIYRWRGSDWSLLDSVIEKDFAVPTEQIVSLKGNYRTQPAIVHFNNAFFAAAARQLDALWEARSGRPGGLSELYQTVGQEVRVSDPAEGSVEAVFFDAEEEEMPEILASIEALLAAGAGYDDIAILVRNNREGSRIAEQLIVSDIPVISDDALFVKSSVTVRRLVSQLSLLSVSDGVQRSVAGYLAETLGLEMPKDYHSLTDLSEKLLQGLQAYDPQRFEAEVPYIQAFQDYLQEWSQNGGHELAQFLREWEEADPRIAPPEGARAVRIMTIHKSKGLEFPFVIVPYIEKITLYHRGASWCVPKLQGTEFSPAAKAAYSVELSDKSLTTLFREDYLEECRLQYIDNLNLLYVALTRAQKGLKIIGVAPSKTLQNMADILYGHIRREGTEFHCDGEDGRWRTGTPYPWTARVQQASDAPRLLEAAYPMIPLGGRLRSRSDAADFFGDAAVGYQASARIRGKVLHDILASVRTREDLPEAIRRACRSGELPEEEAEATRAFLSGRIAQHPDWFPESGAEILNETSLYDATGAVKRPDRVLITEGRVLVIDYKFGEPRPAYERQIREYVDIFRKMGYAEVRGCLWYVPENKFSFFHPFS